MAIIWPKVRFSLGIRRWITGGKNPSMLEKWWRVSFGVVLNCLFVREASSRARRSPAIDTARAAIFSRKGIVMMGVFRGEIFEVIKSPAIMLPQASRLRGLITAGLFSLIGESELNRGWPIVTKKITRRL